MGAMNSVTECTSLDEVRENIDRIDRQLVALISERGGYVRQAARFKKTTEEVKAFARVEQIIGKVRALAAETEGDPDITEQVYRAMISAFIEAERREFLGEKG